MTTNQNLLTLFQLLGVPIRIIFTIFQIILFDESIISLPYTNLVNLHELPCFEDDDVLILIVVKRLGKIVPDQQVRNLMTSRNRATCNYYIV